MCDQATHDPIVEHRDDAEDNTAADDNATAEAEELQRLRSAYKTLWGKWWDILVHSDSRLRSSIIFPTEVHGHHDSVRCKIRRTGFETTESTEASRGFWDYLATTESIHNDGRLEEAEQRYLRIATDERAPSYCRADAWQLAARCTPDHDLALEYLEKAFKECQIEVHITAYHGEDDGFVNAGSERCDWLWSRSKQRKMQKLLDEGKIGPC